MYCSEDIFVIWPKCNVYCELGDTSWDAIVCGACCLLLRCFSSVPRGAKADVSLSATFLLYDAISIGMRLNVYSILKKSMTF